MSNPNPMKYSRHEMCSEHTDNDFLVVYVPERIFSRDAPCPVCTMLEKVESLEAEVEKLKATIKELSEEEEVS